MSIKKIGTVIVALVMVFSVFTAVPFTAKGAVENQITIYYSNSDYTTANIHYKVGSEWTTAPGVAMESTTDADGYSFKANISLGAETEVTFCFNTNGDNWDNNSSNNYKITGISGNVSYGVKKGTAPIMLTITDIYNRSSQHFVIDTNVSLNAITPESFTQWLTNYDNCYDKYVELTGFTTCGGQKLTMKASPETYGAAWVYGDPHPFIYLNQVYVNDWFASLNNDTNWGFGFLHELGHMFDKNIWNFDAELLANFKMAYVLEELDGPVIMNNKVYTGAEIKDYYKLAYDQTSNMTTEFNGDAFTYTLLDIKDKIGWDSYKTAFRNISQLSPEPATKIEKLNAMLTELRDFSNYDVLSYYTKEQIQILETRFEGTVAYTHEKPNPVLIGDANGDGIISALDVSAIQRYIIDPDNTAIDLTAADTNRDGKISMIDCSRILRYMADLIPEL